MKFLLGNLYDYEPDKHRISNENLTAIDQYMAYRLHQILTIVCRMNLIGFYLTFMDFSIIMILINIECIMV